MKAIVYEKYGTPDELQLMIQALALGLEHVLPRKYRNGLFVRGYLYLVMAISLPLYPAPALMGLGIRNRPPETASILRLTGFFSSNIGIIWPRAE